MTVQLPLVFLSCGVFEGIMDADIEKNPALTVEYLDTGLHNTPKKLHSTVQEQIDAIQQPSVIVLGYGLCGNGLHNIHSDIHTLIIPKMDDCISMFMGGRETYLQKFFENPGAYYLTKGWLAAGTHPLAEYERYLEKYGEKTANHVMDVQFKHYKKLIFVAHSQQDLDEFRPIALKVAEFCKRWDMVYEEFLGGVDFLQELKDTVANPENMPDSFIIVNPGEALTQEMFR